MIYNSYITYSVAYDFMLFSDLYVKLLPNLGVCFMVQNWDDPLTVKLRPPVLEPSIGNAMIDIQDVLISAIPKYYGEYNHVYCNVKPKTRTRVKKN